MDHVDLSIAAHWAKHLCLKPGPSEAATLWAARRNPAVKEMLNGISLGTLKNRLRELGDGPCNYLFGNLSKPTWNYLLLVEKWAKEAGLPCRPLEDLPDMRRLPTLTPQQLSLLSRRVAAGLLLRQRLEPAEFELLRVFIDGS
jgi:hypothetical protein